MKKKEIIGKVKKIKLYNKLTPVKFKVTSDITINRIPDKNTLILNLE